MKLNLSLPNSSSQENLETISRNAMAVLFDPELFEVRDEVQRDKGIDLVVEVKQDKCYTNFRFVIQLKSTASPKVSKNGILSYPIEISNINYLMNYGMPAYYVLYDHIRKLFYFEHVNFVYESLLRKYNDAKLPLNFTISFYKEFTPDVIKDIYNHTIEKGFLLRKLSAHMHGAAKQKSASGIVIDDDNDVYSVEKNIAFIGQFGFDWLNNGESMRVIEIEQRTHPRTKAPAFFNFICGMAYYQQADLLKALHLLRLAQKDWVDFDAQARSLLSYMILDAKYMLGMIEEQVFKKQTADLMQTSELGPFLKIERANQTFNKKGVKDSERITVLYMEVQKIVEEYKTDDKARAMAYGRVLEAEGVILVNDLCENMMLMICIGFIDLLKSPIYQKWLAIEKEYVGRFDMLVKYAAAQHNYLVIGNYSLDKLRWAYEKAYLEHFFKNIDPKTFRVSPPELKTTDKIVQLIDATECIEKIYRELGDREKTISCLRIKYEMWHFAERKTEATTIAAEISDLIEEYDLGGLLPAHNELLNTGTGYEKFVAKFTSRLSHMLEIMENSDMRLKQMKRPSKMMLEVIERNTKWSIEDFLEFDLTSS